MSGFVEIEPGSFVSGSNSSNNDNFCACCLSTKVPLVNLLSCKHLAFFSTIPNFVINNRIKHVCTMCHTMVAKFAEFRQQVVESFQRLNSQAAQLTPNRRHPNLKRTVTKVCTTLNNEMTCSTLHVEFTREPGNIAETEDSVDMLDLVKDETKDSDIEEIDEDSENRYKTGQRYGDVKNVVHIESTVKGRTSERIHGKGNASTLHFEEVYTEDPKRDQTFTDGATQTILRNQKVLLEITNNILENQKTMLDKICGISDYGDPFSSVASEDNALQGETSRSYDVPLKRVESIQDLEQLEERLKDSDYKQKVIKSYSFLCTGGPGLGTTCAYRFIDVLFSRSFLCECSWAGGTQGEGEKICFKFYKHVVQFFSEMIRHWDPSFSLQDTEAFIKICLKNSKQRNESKRLRTSAKRNRPNRIEAAKTRRLIEAMAAGENIEDMDENDGESSANQ